MTDNALIEAVERAIDRIAREGDDSPLSEVGDWLTAALEAARSEGPRCTCWWASGETDAACAARWRGSTPASAARDSHPAGAVTAGGSSLRTWRNVSAPAAPIAKHPRGR